jgi:hypothetical protein
MRILAYDRFKPGVTLETIEPCLAEEVAGYQGQLPRVDDEARRVENTNFILNACSAFVQGFVPTLARPEVAPPED